MDKVKVRKHLQEAMLMLDTADSSLDDETVEPTDFIGVMSAAINQVVNVQVEIAETAEVPGKLVKDLQSADMLQGRQFYCSNGWHFIVTRIGGIAYAVDLETGSTWTRPQMIDSRIFADVKVYFSDPSKKVG